MRTPSLARSARASACELARCRSSVDCSVARQAPSIRPRCSSRKRVPAILVDEKLEHRLGLVPARHIDQLDLVLEALLARRPRADRAPLRRSCPCRRRRATSPPGTSTVVAPSRDMTLPPSPKMRMRKPLMSSLGLDLLGEPAAGLGAAEGAGHDVHLQPGVVVHLLVELAAVAVLEPVEIESWRRDRRGSPRTAPRRGAWPPRSSAGGEAGIDAAARHLVEDLVRLGAVARLLQVEQQGAARALLDQLGEPRGGLAEAQADACHRPRA